MQNSQHKKTFSKESTSTEKSNTYAYPCSDSTDAADAAIGMNALHNINLAVNTENKCPCTESGELCCCNNANPCGIKGCCESASKCLESCAAQCMQSCQQCCSHLCLCCCECECKCCDTQQGTCCCLECVGNGCSACAGACDGCCDGGC